MFRWLWVIVFFTILVVPFPIHAQENRAAITPNNANQLISLTEFGNGTATGIQWSPDGQILAVAAMNGKVWLYDANTLTLIQQLTSDADWIYGTPSFSPDGNLLAVPSAGNAATLWNVATNQYTRLTGHTAQVYSIVFNPSGTLIATGSLDHTVCLWRLNGEQVHCMEGHSYAVNSVAFSPNGKILATASGDATVKLWDTATYQLLATLGTDNVGPIVYTIAFSPDGTTLASGGSDTIIQLWDVNTYTQINQIEDLPGEVNSLIFSNNGSTLIYGGSGTPISTWDLSTGEHRAIINASLNPRILNMAVNPNATKLALVDASGIIRIYDLDNQTQVNILRDHGQIRDADFSPDGLLSVGTSTGITQVWNTTTNRLLFNLQSDEEWVQSTFFISQGSLLISAGIHTIRLWDTSNGQLVGTLETDPEDMMDGYAISSDGAYLGCKTFSGEILVWDLTSKELIHRLDHDVETVVSMDFSLDGTHLALGTVNGTVMLWNLATSEYFVLGNHERRVNNVAFSPNGNLIASAGEDLVIRVWDVATGALLMELDGVEWGIQGLAFNNAGTLLASGHRSLLALWDVSSGALITTFESYHQYIWDIEFSLDDTFLATTGFNGTIQLWGIS